MTFTYATRAQFAQALRRRFRDAQAGDAIRLAKWIFNNLTDAEIRAVWSLTAAQLTALKSRWNTRIAAWESAQNVAGE